jgi:hypothetical protein
VRRAFKFGLSAAIISAFLLSAAIIYYSPVDVDGTVQQNTYKWFSSANVKVLWISTPDTDESQIAAILASQTAVARNEGYELKEVIVLGVGSIGNPSRVIAVFWIP